MKATAIWLDRTQAKIFHFPRNSRKDEIVRASHVEHHTHQRDALDIKREERALYELLANKLKDAEDILIFGPGVAKHHFQNYLVEQHPAQSRKIRLCQTMDHPTEKQIVAAADTFFRTNLMAISS
jgi:stalled ribosome rescue protein Dom34